MIRALPYYLDKMSAVGEMMAMGEYNHTDQCDWLNGENRTEPRVTEQLDAASCLFSSILPRGAVVPALTVIFVLLTLLSLLINALTLFGLGQSDDPSWGPRVAFFKNLILSDLVQTVNISPSVIHSLIHRRTMGFNAWCHLQYFVGCVTVFCSLVTITCMALERYVYVCYAIHYLVILTKVRLRLALCFIWVFSISVSTINTLLLHTGEVQKSEPVTGGLLCEPDMMEQHMGFPLAASIFRKITGSSTLLLCLLAHAFSYFKMYRDARNATIPIDAVNTAARKTVLFYCGMVFLQLLPLLIKVASDALWEFEAVRKERPGPLTMATVFHISLAVMLLVPPCINPLVYGMRNLEMRQALIRTFRWWMERRRAGA